MAGRGSGRGERAGLQEGHQWQGQRDWTRNEYLSHKLRVLRHEAVDLGLTVGSTDFETLCMMEAESDSMDFESEVRNQKLEISIMECEDQLSSALPQGGETYIKNRKKKEKKERRYWEKLDPEVERAKKAELLAMSLALPGINHERNRMKKERKRARRDAVARS